MSTSPREMVEQLVLSAEDMGIRFAEAFLSTTPYPWDDMIYRAVVDVLLAKVIEPILADPDLNDEALIATVRTAAFKGFEAKMLKAIEA